MAITRQDVIDCYRYILGVDMKSDEMIDWHYQGWKGHLLKEMQQSFFAARISTDVSMISYAQNCEDVVLWRALKNVKNGFYIDVGANDPVVDSVTKWFYDQGWRGVNMEPVEQYYHRLKEMRDEDVNLCQGAGAVDGNFNFFEIPGTGLSTLEKEVVDFYREQEDFPYDIKIHEIEVVTLTSVCEKYAIDKDIHFLKIDVEEGEKAVLKGMDFNRFRPWIVVMEVRSNRGSINEEGGDILLDRGYKYTLYDGVNKYYVAKEKYQEVGEVLSMPVCILDKYKCFKELQRQQWYDELYSRYGELRDKIEGF